MQSCINENRKVTKMTDKEEIIIDGIDVSGCKHQDLLAKDGNNEQL